jgi:hypothetical protein
MAVTLAPQKVEILKPVDLDRVYIFSVDFCRRETWYIDSVAVEAEVVGTGNGSTLAFSLNHPWVVDLGHGKVTEEDRIAPPGGSQGGYRPSVWVGTELKTEREAFEASGGDYTLDYETGDLTFFTAPGEGVAVTASYFYVPDGVGPCVKIVPVAGKKTIINTHESQFSADWSMDDTIIVEIRATQYPGFEGVDILLDQTKLKTVGNVLDWFSGSFPVIPANGGGIRGLSSDILIGRVDYISTINLLSSIGMYLKCFTEHARGFGGERAAMTYYGYQVEE